MNEKKCLKCGKSWFGEVINADGEDVMMEIVYKQLHYMPLIPRLKQLFILKKAAMHMRWHKDCECENNNVIVHPSDGEAWKALDYFDLEFAWDARNVRIGLATNGFTPFTESAASYSCWPVFGIPYNLPPALCMKYEHIFLYLIIPGPDNPRPQLNVMMQLLIEELKQLWVGVEAYDWHKKKKFNLRVAYLWSIQDFCAHGIFFGWCVHGNLTCPICTKDTDCFRLEFGKKIYYFDCHRCFLPPDHTFRLWRNAFRKDTIVEKGPPRHQTGQEIFEELNNLKISDGGKEFEGYGEEHNWTHKCGLWELPYLKALILMHNIDFMHLERNVAESIVMTCMNFLEKSKDNKQARKDLAMICHRPSHELSTRGTKPHAPFCMKAKERKEVMTWMKNLKFLDGFVAGFRRAINLKIEKLIRL
jgi:hypothetical protein